MTIDLRDVACALAVADEGGFRAAADELGLSQPALSQRVAKLEAALGAPLFHRLGRSIALTPAGEAFLEPARVALRDGDLIEAAVAEVTGLRAGTLEVYALPSIVVSHLARLVGAYRQAHPGVLVRVTGVEDSAAVVDAVRSARCDLGVCDVPADAHGLAVDPWLHQDLLVVLPPGSPVPPGGTVAIEDLADRPVALTPVGTSLRALVEALYATAGLAVPVGVETNQRDALVPLALHGAGITFVTESLADDAERRGAVVARVATTPRRAVALLTRTRGRSPALTAFQDLARQLG